MKPDKNSLYTSIALKLVFSSGSGGTALLRLRVSLRDLNPLKREGRAADYRGTSNEKMVLRSVIRWVRQSTSPNSIFGFFRSARSMTCCASPTSNMRRLDIAPFIK